MLCVCACLNHISAKQALHSGFGFGFGFGFGLLKQKMILKMNDTHWKNRIVPSERVLEKIRPGMNIFLGTAAAEPRTLVKHLMTSDAANLLDPELSQLVSLDAISLKAYHSRKYRVKTFFSGWQASEAITAGLADLIPSRYSQIPQVIRSGQIPVDVGFVQITPPDKAGYCSLGVSVDVARQAMELASLTVGEINHPF
ncbi:hypothetical protein QUF72_01135 [Desulfobacterales bacterium HSG2]|nr:hypothetical protein [Desulfobacterales bacterium HSG2]